jgi:uncharacterized protein YggE
MRGHLPSLLIYASMWFSPGLALEGEAPRLPARHLDVVGIGEVRAAPDMAEVTLGVVSQGATAVEVAQKNAAAMRRVLEAAKALGIEERLIRTTQLTLIRRPAEVRRGPGASVEGLSAGDGGGPEAELIYEMTHLVHVQIGDLEKLGSFLDQAVQAGANRLQGVQFVSTRARDYEDQAWAAAVQDAQRKASVLAEAAGVRLGRIWRIRTGPEIVPVMRADVAALASGVPVAPGELTFRAQVRVTYELGE